MKKKELMTTMSSTPSSKREAKKAFSQPNVYEIARQILHFHIKESKGLFISQDDLPIKGPITEEIVSYSITVLKHEKDPQAKKLLEDIATQSIYASARVMAREALAAQV